MSPSRLFLAPLLLLLACASPEDDAGWASPPNDGKADSTGEQVDVEWCKEVAGSYARDLYNDFEDFEILDTTVATVLETGADHVVIQTDSTGHGRSSTDVILVATECYPIGSMEVIEDLDAATFYAGRAARAARDHVLATWDFDRIVSSELRWPITLDGVTVDVTVLDGGHDEGTFAVELSRSGQVRRIEETGGFTP